jgi:hypothetical protein
MLSVAVDTRGKKAFQTKAAAHARYGPTSSAEARFTLEMQRNRTSGRRHERGLIID